MLNVSIPFALILCQEASSALDSKHEHAKDTGDAPRADKEVANRFTVACALILCQEAAALASKHEHAKDAGDAPREDKEVANRNMCSMFPWNVL